MITISYSFENYIKSEVLLMNKDKKEITSAITHGIGAVLSVIGTAMLLLKGSASGDGVRVISLMVFGVSMVLLYATSAFYHSIDPSKTKIKLIMRKMDHMMIFVLIAGSYTPICVLTLGYPVGYRLLAAVWFVTLVGFIVKIFWINAPRWVCSGLYILMGWMAVWALIPLVKSLPTGGMVWLVLGGLIYTVGGVIYGLKKPDIDTPWFGFHELFHLFVMGGTLCHFITI